MSLGSTPPPSSRDSFSGSESFSESFSDMGSTDSSTESLTFPSSTSSTSTPTTVLATNNSPSPPQQTVSTAAKTNSTGAPVVKENGRLKRAYEWVKNQFVAKKLTEEQRQELGEFTEVSVRKFEDLGTDRKWRGLAKGSGATVLDADALDTWVAKDSQGRAHGKGVIISDPVSVYEKKTEWNSATQKWDSVEKKVGEYRHVTTAQFKHGQIVGDLLEERYLLKDPNLFKNTDPLEKTVSKPSPFSAAAKAAPSIPDPDLTEEEPVSFNPPTGCTRKPIEYEGGTLSMDYDSSEAIRANPNAIWRDSNNNHYLVSVNEQGQVNPNSWRAVTVDHTDPWAPQLKDPQPCRMPLAMFQSEVARNGLPTDFADRLKEYSAHPGFVENQDVGGKSYTGFVDANKKPTGLGILEEPAAIQQGMFANGILIEGKRSNPDGTVYLEGKFDAAGKLEGHGTKVTADSKYEGHFTAGEYNGAGTLTSKDGNIHEGMFVNGQKHGFGRASKPNPDRDPVLSPHLPERLEESGLYENGNHVAGTGKVDLQNGAVFYGQVTVDASGKQVPAAGKGFITMRLPDTEFINEGEFDHNAVPIGTHKITSTAIDLTVEADFSTNPPTVKDNPVFDNAGQRVGTYNGQFQSYDVNGLPLPSGKGELKFNNNVKFTGTFANGNLVKGDKDYPGQGLYRGEFDGQGRLQGEGVLTDRPQGVIYSGHFVDGKLHGKGMKSTTTKGEYDGTFANNEFIDGLCRNVRLDNGWIYSGKFSSSKPNGEGNITLSDGSKWKGGFANGIPTGFGDLKRADGTVVQAEYNATTNTFVPIEDFRG